VAVAVEDDGGDVAHDSPLALATALEVLGDGR
jgi:hypothetical protein